MVAEPERVLKEFRKTPYTLFQHCLVYGLCSPFIADSQKNNKEVKLEAELNEV